jgi:FkbM family methyltransferase
MKKILSKVPGFEVAYSLWQRRTGNSLEELLEHFARSRQGDVYFIQIGANDGVGNDPFVDVLTRFSWRGICVEPQAKAFSALKAHYARNARIVVENAAIAEQTGTQTMFRISFSDDKWASRLTSLRHDVLEKQIESGYVGRKAKEQGIAPPHDRESWISEEVVTTLTFADLLAKHDMPRVDALLLDVEGYEWPILRQFDFAKHKPSFVALERMHLSDADRANIVSLLGTHGYRVRKTRQNFVGLC